MIIYTFSSALKDKLLSNNQTLRKQKTIDGKTVYIFEIKNPNFLYNFSSKERKEIFFLNNNKMNF